MYLNYFKIRNSFEFKLLLLKIPTLNSLKIKIIIMLNLLKKSSSLLKFQREFFSKKVFKLPSIAESVEEVTIVNFIKQEGEFVN